MGMSVMPAPFDARNIGSARRAALRPGYWRASPNGTRLGSPGKPSDMSQGAGCEACTVPPHRKLVAVSAQRGFALLRPAMLLTQTASQGLHSFRSQATAALAAAVASSSVQ